MKQTSQMREPSSPRASRQIREQLADLAEVIASMEAYGERDFASKMTLQSTYAHKRELLKELEEAELFEAAQQTNGNSRDHSTSPTD